MRPLVVSHTGVTGGSTQVILGLLRHRPPEVEPVCAFLAGGPAVQAVRDLGIEAQTLPPGRTRDVVQAARAMAALVRLVRTRGVDVVFAHTSKAQVYAGPAASVAGVPNLWYAHEVPGLERAAPGRTRVLQELAARIPTHAVICSSDFVARCYAQRWPGANVHRIHPGVETDGVPVREHTAAGGVRIVVVGRLQRWKRVDRALEAMAHVLEAEPDARLGIVGAGRPDVDPGHSGELRTLAADLGIAHAVEFAGDVPGVSEQLAGADILVHAADREAFGLPVAEALLRGIPVVAAPVGGAAEIVRDGVDGFLVDPEDTPALAGVLVRLVRDPGARAAMGAAGRERALERLDERRAAAETWRLVARAASCRR